MRISLVEKFLLIFIICKIREKNASFSRIFCNYIVLFILYNNQPISLVDNISILHNFWDTFKIQRFPALLSVFLQQRLLLCIVQHLCPCNYFVPVAKPSLFRQRSAFLLLFLRYVYLLPQASVIALCRSIKPYPRFSAYVALYIISYERKRRYSLYDVEINYGFAIAISVYSLWFVSYSL